MKETVIPYKDRRGGKKEQVAEMFDNISSKYDLLNRVLSMGIDKRWRKKAIKLLRESSPKKILDIATGTADFAIESLKLQPKEVIGVDISEGMLEIGRQKIEKLNVGHIIKLQSGDSENLGFEENFFDAAIVAFGVRNFENLRAGLENIHRVVRSGGKLVVLEFSMPEKFPMKQLYRFYSKYVLPKIGKTVSKDTAAYSYLPESVEAFPYGKEFLNILEVAGFRNGKCIPLTFGICSIYIAEK